MYTRTLSSVVANDEPLQTLRVKQAQADLLGHQNRSLCNPSPRRRTMMSAILPDLDSRRLVSVIPHLNWAHHDAGIDNALEQTVAKPKQRIYLQEHPASDDYTGAIDKSDTESDAEDGPADVRVKIDPPVEDPLDVRYDTQSIICLYLLITRQASRT
jgi:hypothetical protein